MHRLPPHGSSKTKNTWSPTQHLNPSTPLKRSSRKIWHFEIRNVLVFAARRGRIQWPQIRGLLKAINVLRIDTDQNPDFDAAMELALTHNLSFYDALYLELAKWRNAPLATLDNALARAATNEGLL